ncbi:hypothetical protein CU102_00085 [Phyllobacterium brassicacearum]|uniref:Lipoprotein n=1 Tax=Phyllobacterium brassicacearum TaxID=314235 RepID=A0A2P7BVL1_9HYPH|nr:hypothetical protein [Phyllobacterium brassicacearum]PSH70504.1 hypothetical protein CU102_00085 [Phyllobacterium brassicacearum]
MRFSVLAGAAMAIAVSACSTSGSKGASESQVIADAKGLVIISYQCQDALGREPHYSAIDSSETILKTLGRSPDDADRTVRGWLKDVIAGPKQPSDLDAKTCKDRLLTLAEKVRIGYEALKARS